jgi:rare lipoprotein A
VVVTNQHNGKKVTVRVNDRGPFVAARIIDVSRAAAEQLDMIATGTAPVLVESVEKIAVSRPAAAVTPVQVAPIQAAPAPVQAVPAAPAAPVQAAPVAPAPAFIAPPVQTAPVYVQPTPPAASAIPVPAASQIKLTPEINVLPNKSYRLQVGSYRVARNAVETFERLKNAGLNPAYERYEDSEKGDLFRVVLAGIPGTDVGIVAEKLRLAGFREALIRVEN